MANATHMVLAAARALCRSAPEICNVDFEDNWKIYGDEIYKPEAQLALDACGAPELLEALQAIFAAMHPDIPGAPGGAIEKARAAIAKATGSAS